MLKIEITDAIKELKKFKARRGFLQIPEGLKTKIDEIVEELETRGFEIITSMDLCFGACDLKQKEAKLLGCDAILHLGHTKFVEKTSVPTVYAPLKYELGERFEKICSILAEWMKDEKIKETGVVTTAQFLQYLPLLKEELSKYGIKITIGKGQRTENGQVLGCNYSSAMVKPNSIIYFGDGLFHPLGIHYATKKAVIIANPITLEIKTLEEEKEEFLKRRIMLIERAKQAKSYAILVSSKEGQNRITDELKIKKELESNRKNAKIYIMDFISNDALLGTKAEAFINTACPRISIDDFMQYKKPIINKNEIDYLLGKKDYENYELEVVY
ncbi:MAG: diphthamide biosynthesis enzyme Dph2 [Candidatus Diapherotrites archaeon]|nr:diphthamide biosynthesis enzyme Dph2 [Candidatus Diapherotrites archaeon]